MIRLACGIALVSLAPLFAMLLRTDASTAIPFSVLGHGGAGLAIGLLAWHLWRPIRLGAEERALHQLTFESLSARDFAHLLSLGAWHDSGPGEALMRAGEPVRDVHVLASGSVSVTSQGQQIATLGPGQMIGSSAIFGDGEVRADAVSEERTRHLSWPVTSLRSALDAKPSLRAALQAIVIEDLTTKLRSLT